MGDAHLQDGAVVKVVSAGPALQGGEGHIAACERGDVTELIGAQCLLLIPASADEATIGLAIGVLAGAAVVLIWHPRPILSGALVDGKTLGPAGVELEAHVGDIKGLAWWGDRWQIRWEWLTASPRCPVN